MTAPLTDAQLDEILGHVPNCRYGCAACEAAPALIAEIRRLLGDADAQRGRFARALADRNDEYFSVEAERVRLATDLGARDAELAAAQVEREDLQAAYKRLGDQAARITEAASQFRAKRDRLHDALGHVLVGPWESNGAGDVRSPWIPAGEAEGWRRLLAGTPRSEREGETAQECPEAPVAPSEPSVDAPGPGSAQRGAVDRDGAAR